MAGVSAGREMADLQNQVCWPAPFLPQLSSPGALDSGHARGFQSRNRLQLLSYAQPTIMRGTVCTPQLLTCCYHLLGMCWACIQFNTAYQSAMQIRVETVLAVTHSVRDLQDIGA